MDAPSLRTTVVGSFPPPPWLTALPTGPSLVDAVQLVVKLQEDAGIDVISDGELSRFDADQPETNGMIEFFVDQLDGMRTRVGRADAALFAADRAQAEDIGYRSRPGGVVDGPLGPGTLDLPAGARLLRTYTKSGTKCTVTSPYMLMMFLLDRHYGDRRELCLALADVLAEQVAEIDADVVQVDDARLPGHPQDGDLAVEAINRLLDRVRGERAVHLCYGNYGGQTVQRGTYDALVAPLAQLHADHLVLELAHRGPGELPALASLPAAVGIGLGVVDVKSLVIESADDVARRIEEAAAVLGADRLRYIHPDCGFSVLPRNVVVGKLHALTAGRDLFLGRS